MKKNQLDWLSWEWLIKVMFLLFFSIGTTHTTWAQSQLKITGNVVDTQGEPIIGASVVVKGTSNGTITDFEGNFQLNTEKKGSLVISYIGYVTKEVTIKPTLKIVLAEDTKALDEVVVVGYGTQKKSDLTGSVTSVKAAEITAVTSNNPLESLQGRAPGVAVFTNNAPGESPILRIRGAGSIQSGNDPLYVVDGFPLMNGSLNDINPADIASMEILKDASSTAIYGSRGANGVVLITTKSGSTGRKNLSVNASFGIQSAARLVDLLETNQFIPYINEAYENRGGQAPFKHYTPTANTDWQREAIEKSAIVQNYTVSLDGGSENTNYMMSLGYYSQDGLVKNVGYDKLTLHSNLNHNFTDWLTIGSHIQMAYSEKDGNNDVMTGLFQRGWPTMPVYNEDGSYYVSSLDPIHSSYIEGNFNPIADINGTTATNSSFRALGDIYAEFQLLKNLKFKTTWGADINNIRKYSYTSSQTATNIATNGTGAGNNAYHRNITKLTENMLTYNNTWGNHRFSATGVYSWQEYTYEDMSMSATGFENDATGAWDMTLGDRNSLNYESTKYSNKLISLTARFTYAYKDKYLLTATGRYDGSSRFGENNKYGFFPSAGIAWRVEQEPFMQKIRMITNFKLRASYGVTGNQEIGNYQSLALLSKNNYIYDNNILMGFKEGIENSDLKWERTHQIDLGFDLSLWDRLNITFDYYTRRTTDMLYNVPIPTTSGFSSILSNVGEVKNNGYEFTIGGRVIDRNFKLDISLNGSHNNNEITELYGDVTRIDGSTNAESGLTHNLVVGQPVNGVWGRKSLGIIRTQEQLNEYTSRIKSEQSQLGSEMYADLNMDGTINTQDYICYGSTEPKFFYGISINMKYKGFGLDIYGQGACDYASGTGGDAGVFTTGAGAYGYSNVSNFVLWADNNVGNSKYLIPSKDAYKEMWSESNPNGTRPRIGAKNAYLSDRTNANWSYFLIKNIQLSYEFKTRHIQSMQVYVNAQNYISFANHSGYNPINGDVSHPWAKIITLGINAKF